MFKLFSNIYFIVYKLYYIGQNDDLVIRVSLKNWDGGSTILTSLFIDCCATSAFCQYGMHDTTYYTPIVNSLSHKLGIGAIISD
jgi:hypothetical protein